jgi:hypothetical protein
VRLKRFKSPKWQGFMLQPVFMFVFNDEVLPPGQTPAPNKETPAINSALIKSLAIGNEAFVMEEAAKLAEELGLGEPDMPDLDEAVERLTKASTIAVSCSAVSDHLTPRGVSNRSWPSSKRRQKTDAPREYVTPGFPKIGFAKNWGYIDGCGPERGGAGVGSPHGRPGRKKRFLSPSPRAKLVFRKHPPGRAGHTP